MSKRDRAKKANAIREQIRAKKEAELIIKKIKRDQFGWGSKKVY